MKASILDVTATRPPRVWSKLLMVVAIAPAADLSTTMAPAEPVVVSASVVAQPEPPPPEPRQLPSGAPACGNVASRAPRPRACEPRVVEAAPCAHPRVMASGAPACGNVTARPLPERAPGHATRRSR